MNSVAPTYFKWFPSAFISKEQIRTSTFDYRFFGEKNLLLTVINRFPPVPTFKLGMIVFQSMCFGYDPEPQDWASVSISDCICPADLPAPGVWVSWIR